MKVLHNIFFPELLVKESKRIVAKVDSLDDYAEDDLNIFLCISILISCDTLKEEKKEEYINAVSEYLNSRGENLPLLEYKGELADEYTRLVIQKNNLTSDPEYQNFMTSTFNALHFEGDMPVGSNKTESISERSVELSLKNHEVLKKIQKEIGYNINTTAWPRDKQTQKFDYSLPATLILEIFKYDTEKFHALENIAKNIVSKFEVSREIDFVDQEDNETFYCWTISIEGNF